MAYIIGIILVIIVLLVIGLIMRKRIYDMVDRVESWKANITERDVASEIGRIKTLNLSGETQESFEKWKDHWEDIVAKQLPDVEEYLFDAEESADKFRFKKSKKILQETEERLQSIEKDIDTILNELNTLLESEETSREEVDEMEPAIKSLRKQISQNRYQYGKADEHFDEKLDELEERLSTYYEMVDEGNYIEGKKLVSNVKKELDELGKTIQDFPSIYKMCKHELPSQLDNLSSGIKEMKEEGYHVAHLSLEKEINSYKERLTEMLRILDEGILSEVETVLADMNERIKEMYELLEKEAIAKNYLETKIPSYEQSLHELEQNFVTTKLEVEQLRRAYYFEDADMETFLSIENTITNMKEQLDEVHQNMDNKDISHSELREEIERGFLQLDEVNKKHEAFRKRIHNMRKDELEAKEKLNEMRKELFDLQRKLKKSNIPGVPAFIWTSLENVAAKNDLVIQAFDQQPLEMKHIQEALNNANDELNRAVEQTNLMIEQAYLTEQVIQYANRYRSKDPGLAAKLKQAEKHFRAYQYELALETAVKALEEVEPGALKRIEENQMALQ